MQDNSLKVAALSDCCKRRGHYLADPHSKQSLFRLAMTVRMEALTGASVRPGPEKTPQGPSSGAPGRVPGKGSRVSGNDSAVIL